MFDPVFPQQATEILARLFSLVRGAPRDVRARLRREGAELNPDLLSNLRQFGFTPTPRQLSALKSRLSLTTGGAFELFGYKLDRMRAVEALLNGGRTRFVEAYPFHRDRLVDLPGVLGGERVFQDTAYLSDLVERWQENIPIRSIRGPHWQKDGFAYAQLGSGDRRAMPKIPPGAYIAIRPINEPERLSPEPRAFYFLQHGWGYVCSRCVVRQGKLSLVTEDHIYPEPYEFFYPAEARIVGRVASFGANLAVPTGHSAPQRRTSKAAPLVLPWEHTSLRALVSAERQRFGIADVNVTSANAILESRLGATVSARTLRRYEQEKERTPRTSVLIGLALLYSLRFTDVLRVLDLWTDETRHHSLDALLKATSYDDLPAAFPPAIAPHPISRWQTMLDEWGEWPTLLSMTMPNLRQWGTRVLRINQSDRFRGLDPLIAPHSMVVLDELNLSPPSEVQDPGQLWKRPIYALRHDGETLCGYVETHGTDLALLPHPAAGIPRSIFRKQRTQVLGQVVAVASPL